jgi:hypothetical protein
MHQDRPLASWGVNKDRRNALGLRDPKAKFKQKREAFKA